MGKQYGPSNYTKKQNLIRKLFGNDSENENENEKNDTNQNKTTTVQSQAFDTSDGEHGEVLEITIDNENFVTPIKVTNTLAQEKTFKSPAKPTHTHTVSQILGQTTRHVELLSPIKEAPIQNVHIVSPISDQSLSHSLVQSRSSQNQSISLNNSNITNTHTHTPNNTHAWSKKRFASAFTSRKRLPYTTHTNTNNNNQLPKRNTTTFASSVRTASNTQPHTRSKPYTLNRSSYNCTSSHTPTNRQYNQASNKHIVTQIQANVLSSHTRTLTQNQSIQSSTLARTITHTFTQNQSSILARTQTHTFTQKQPSTLARSHAHSKQSHKQNVSNSLIQIYPKIIPTPPHTQPQSNEQKRIVITVPNTPITHTTERQTNLGQSNNLNQNSKPLPPNTKIIQLNNKYVPKGVHLAIAIEKNKKLSKNAIKKITRNYAAQL